MKTLIDITQGTGPLPFIEWAACRVIMTYKGDEQASGRFPDHQVAGEGDLLGREIRVAEFAQD